MTTIQVKDATGTTQVVNTLPNNGQATSSGSLPVVLANDQSTVPVNVSTLPLPTGASTATLQTTGNGTLTNIENKLPNLVTGRVPVDGSAVTQPISASSLPLPTGAAIESGGNLAAILAKLPTSPSTSTLQTSILNAIQAGIYAGENHIGAVSGQGTVVAVTLTRPADTTAYAALDTIADSTSAPTIISFANVARVNAGTGYIVKARLETNQSTNVARFRLHLYHTTPTAINDNAACTVLWANRANKIGFIDFDPAITEGTGSDVAITLNASARLKFTCATGSKTIYGILQTRDAFTPVSAQNFYIELTSEVD